jgi:hypothetical protein
VRIKGRVSHFANTAASESGASGSNPASVVVSDLNVLLLVYFAKRKK